MPPISESSPWVYVLIVAVGGLFTALMKFQNDAINESRKGEREARAEAKAEREGVAKEIIGALTKMSAAQNAMAEAQEAQYAISDGLIRSVRELMHMDQPERPPPGRAAAPAPRKRSTGQEGD